jgi:threonine dehydrogenase-like Zn-dependent dehydrogenase
MITILDGANRGMEMVNNEKLNMKPLVTHKYSLKDIEEAFIAARDKPEGFIKAVVCVD